PDEQLDSMATELDRRCPICLDTMNDASHVMPCLHQFCFGCIQRWAESRPTCPLCKRRVNWGTTSPQGLRLCQTLRITAWPGLEGTSKIGNLQPPATGRATNLHM
uniref:RING-type E3 ubiquitin transferase n=1 Tax=Phasianus colchicus TaxID=9054 RepID=A0A669QN44_PHACC